MEMRYHPIIESLKVNEDGTIIELNNERLVIKTTHHPSQRKPTLSVHVNGKRVTVQKLVCEAWHGVTPTAEHVARRVDENAGNHYKNLFWGKRGMTVSSVIGSKAIENKRKMTMEVYEDIIARSQNSTVDAILKELNISDSTFYKFRKLYVNKK